MRIIGPVPGSGNPLLQPKLPPHARLTFAILQPRSTHFRRATCAEVECPHMVTGWVTTVDEATELGAMQAHYIRREAGRSFTEARGEDGLTSFTFPAGQPCFRQADHRISLEREPIFVRREGDHRGNPRAAEARVFARADQWVDDFASHQDRLATHQRRG